MRMLLGVLLAIGLVSGVEAQTMSGISLGDPYQSIASHIGLPPSAKNEMGPVVVQKWVFPDDNELSVTALRQSGQVVYMETNWGGNHHGSLSDIPGLIYGQTTLSEIRKRFGSNGFMYKRRGGVLQVEDGMVFLNSYEIAGDPAVVTFITKIDKRDLARSKNDPAAYAKLDAIIISNAEYLDVTWGKEKAFDTKYRKISL